jgi:hypothetical protein
MLEMIEVDHECRERLTRAPRSARLLVKFGIQIAAVEHARQRIAHHIALERGNACDIAGGQVREARNDQYEGTARHQYRGDNRFRNRYAAAEYKNSETGIARKEEQDQRAKPAPCLTQPTLSQRCEYGCDRRERGGKKTHADQDHQK